MLACALLAPPGMKAQDTVVASGRNVGPVKPGDVLRVGVYRDKERSGDFLIDSRGIVQIPGIGDVMVGGFNPIQIKARLKDELAKQGLVDPDLSLQLLIRVNVLGEVKGAGVQTVDPGTNIIQLLTVVGGPTDQADLKRARVLRDGKSFQVDIESALQGSASGRVVLYSNDVLIVPARTGLFRRENIPTIVSSLTAFLAVVNLVVTLRR